MTDSNELSPGRPTLDYLEKFAGWALPLFIVVAFLFWGGRNLWDTSEARYGQAAFEMLHTGNWLVPTLGSAPHLTKPPLTYWMIALGLKLFGVNSWGARFFLSVAFFFTILSVRELAATMGFDRRQSLAAALVFATSAIPFAAGHTLTTDCFLTLWETIGVLAAWKVWRGDEGKIAVWRFVYWLAFGLAFLTKGPPGWLPFLAIAAFILLRRDKAPERRLFSPLCFAFFLIVSFLWYGIIILRQHQMLGYFVKDEVYKRIFTTSFHRNAPFWIYLPVLLLGVGPWLVLWPGLLKKTWRCLIGKAAKFRDWPLFLILWVVLPLTVFTISKSRLVFYVLPLFVPISLGMGRVLASDFMPRLQHSARWRKGAMAITVFWAALLIFATTGLDLVAKDRSLHGAAAAFNQKIAQLPDPGPCYWFGGSQPYSLAFYMHRILKDTDSLTPEPEAADSKGTPLFVARYSTFQGINRQGKPAAGDLRPQVLAISQGCVMFTTVTQTQAEVRHNPSSVKAGKSI